MSDGQSEQTRRRKRNQYPDGIAIDPREVSCSSEPQRCDSDDTSTTHDAKTADLFVTMCFFARLGFIQPPSCLKCAYRSSTCTNESDSEKIGQDSTTTPVRKCNELVPWRIDANIPLHPKKLEGNVVFITCDTASSLVNGHAYPSIRWDAKSKHLIISKSEGQR